MKSCNGPTRFKFIWSQKYGVWVWLQIDEHVLLPSVFDKWCSSSFDVPCHNRIYQVFYLILSQKLIDLLRDKNGVKAFWIAFIKRPECPKAPKYFSSDNHTGF